MSKLFAGIFLALALASGSLLIAEAQERAQDVPLTNEAIVKLVRAGFKDKTIIAIMRSRPSRFDLAPDRLIELKKNGVSENVILAMIAQTDETLAASIGWDDTFFDNGSKSSKNAGDQAGTDIFGSSGGSRGRMRNRTGNGTNDNDSQTTGSATVRILRPPAETGVRGAPKLERTPTLNNDSIIQMVEAGFSEGTIIRRIEQSPADFDLSPTKLTELRKHRVSEPIIGSMTAAMKDDSASPAKPEK